MVESKPYRPPEGNAPKKLTEKNKGQEPNSNKYRGTNTQTKYQGTDTKANTDFKVWCSDLEGYIFYLGTISSEKFTRKMN